MKKLLRLTPVLAAAALLAGCQGPCSKIKAINAPELASGNASFSTYAAVGTSISAGWQSGGLVDRHQVHAFPALFAQQAGKTVLPSGQGSFTLPAISADGIPQLMWVHSYVPLLIDTLGRTRGTPVNLAQTGAYHNLGVPGSLAYDFLNSDNYYANTAPIHRTNFTMFQLIARGPSRGSLAAQLYTLGPSFISFEYGANEVLGAATAGNATSISPAANYSALLAGSLNSIHTTLPFAKLALFNVPDVTTIPFCTTFRWVTVQAADMTTPAPLLARNNGGTTVTLRPRDLVLLTASDSLKVGTGFAVGAYNYLNPLAPGNGRPLAAWQVLDSAEVATIRTATNTMNAAIDAQAAASWIAKVDMAGLLRQASTTGYRLGGQLYTGAYITGGLFSLDGVHPNDLAHALLCNLMIDAVNAKFQARVPRLNPANYATTGASGLAPASRADGLPSPMSLSGLEAGLRMLFPWQE